MVTILGPRQAGKTTLDRSVFPDRSYYSLEDPDLRIFAESDPRGFLAGAGEKTRPLFLPGLQGERGRPSAPEGRADFSRRNQVLQSFIRDFLRGLEDFKALGIPRTARGLVLYNGKQEFETEGLRISNPFSHGRDLWDLVTGSALPS